MCNRPLPGGCSRTRACGRENRRCCPLFSRHFFVRHVQELRRPGRPIPASRPRLAQMKAIRFPKIFSRKKNLRAATTRRATASGADFDDPSEPNMKLSRALSIVLLLHVVAVAGIIAFNAIKTRQASLPAAPSQTTIGIASAETKPQAPVPNPSALPKTAAKTPAKVSDSGKVYVVAKGDNPVTIAKKYKVSYDDLLALNHIDDPRKLKIGQKLLIPDKIKTTKKGE